MINRAVTRGFAARALTLALSLGVFGIFLPTQDFGVTTARAAQSPFVGFFAGIADEEDPAFPGDAVAYRVEITNFGEEEVRDVTFAAETPEGTTFKSATSSLGACNTPAAGGTGAVTCEVGTLGGGGTAELRFAFDSALPAGSTVIFHASVTSSAPTIDLEEKTFVVAEGDPILVWDPPAFFPAPRTDAPRFLRVERAKRPLFLPTQLPIEPRLEGFTYRVYRSDSPGVQPTDENLFAVFANNQRSTGSIALPGGSFFVVTASFPNGAATLPSNEVSQGRGEPTVDKVKVKGTQLVATGSGFDDSVVVTVDGLTFNRPADVKKANTRVVQSGKLSNGNTVARYLRPGRRAIVCFRNANGSTSCFLYGAVSTVP